MSTFVLPATTVATEFASAPSVLVDDIRPLVIGPRAGLHRYDNADEKELIDLGAYNHLADTFYDWPDVATDSVIDTDSVKLFVDDALLQYYYHPLAGAGGPFTIPSGYKNRVQSTSVNFAENTATYPRSALLYDRDVEVGDIVDVSGTVSAVTYAKRTYVQGIIGAPIAAVTAAAVADSSNKTTQGLSVTSSQTAGCANYVKITATSGTLYNGIDEGNITETYTVTVIQAPLTPGDATTALFGVTSASGNDDVASVAPAAYASPSTIGTRGLTATFSNTITTTTTTNANVCDVLDDFELGQEWTIVANQAYTSGTAVSAGTYTGPQSMTYIVECTLGGRFTDTVDPQVVVTSSTGIDSSGPTTVATNASSIAVGTFGVTMAFGSYTGLVKGDKWSVTVTAVGVGAMKILLLGDNLADGVLTATDLSVRLYIKKNIEVDIQRLSDSGVFNYDVAQDGITVNSAMDAYDDTWTDGGVQLPLAVLEGELFSQYREWLTSDIGKILSYSDLTEVVAELGEITSDNPIAWAASKVVANANGALGFACITDDPSVEASWTDAIAAITNVSQLYNIVPLTKDPTVLGLFKDHVEEQSAPEIGARRALWANLTVSSTIAIVDAAVNSDGLVALATTIQNGSDPGFTLLTCTTGNAKFVTRGVLPNDTVRFLYTTDAWFTVTYSEFTVESVTNEDQLILSGTGTSVAISTPSKMEVWRSLDNDGVTDDLIAQRVALESTRVRCVWPDEADALPGYYVCAALAGLGGGCASNQGLRNVQLLGFIDMGRANTYLTQGNVDRLTRNGVWVVLQTPEGLNYSKSAVTAADPLTAPIEETEEMIVRNHDAMDFAVINSLGNMIGSANIVNGTLTTIRGKVSSLFGNIQANGATSRLGTALIGATIDDLRVHALLKDRIVLTLTYTLPAPLNVVEVDSTVVI